MWHMLVQNVVNMQALIFARRVGENFYLKHYLYECGMWRLYLESCEACWIYELIFAGLIHKTYTQEKNMGNSQYM